MVVQARVTPQFIHDRDWLIVGLEIPLENIGGKWKTSQNRPEVDKYGVIKGLQDNNGHPDNAIMADLVKQHTVT